MPASGYRGPEADAAAPLLIRRTGRAPLGALLLVIALLWLASATRGLLRGDPAVLPGLGSSGAYLAGALGAALALLALDWLVRGRTVAISRGTVAVSERSLLGRRTWREPLANYGEIRACREQRPHRAGVRSWYVVRLCHPEPARAIDLARAKDPVWIERRAHDLARGLGLPLSWPQDTATARPARAAERRHEIAPATVAGKSLSAG